MKKLIRLVLRGENGKIIKKFRLQTVLTDLQTEQVADLLENCFNEIIKNYGQKDTGSTSGTKELKVSNGNGKDISGGSKTKSSTSPRVSKPKIG